MNILNAMSRAATTAVTIVLGLSGTSRAQFPRVRHAKPLPPAYRPGGGLRDPATYIMSGRAPKVSMPGSLPRVNVPRLNVSRPLPSIRTPF